MHAEANVYGPGVERAPKTARPGGLLNSSRAYYCYDAKVKTYCSWEVDASNFNTS